jgi:hypothetical protein
MAYHILKDGEVFEVKLKGEIVHFKCCDCSSVHDIAFAKEKNGKLGIAVRRNNRATSAARRNFPLVVKKFFKSKYECIDSYCKICGKDVIDFQVSDKLWKQIAGEHNTLCYDCFTKRARELGICTIFNIVPQVEKKI